MLLYLTTLNLVRFLTENVPKLKEDEYDIQVISVVDAWKHSDFLCRNYAMNVLTNTMSIQIRKLPRSYENHYTGNIKPKMLGLRRLSWVVSLITKW